MSNLRFDVTDLNCGGCAGSAERVLSVSESVSEAPANFASRKAQVDTAAHAGALQALTKAGYPVAENDARPDKVTQSRRACRRPDSARPASQ